MVISQGKKVEFHPYVEIAHDVFDIRWGKEDVTEKVGKFDEKKGEWVLTGEVKETNLCTYEIHRFYGSKPTPMMLTNTFAKGRRIPNMAELKVIGEALEMSAEQMLPWMKEQMKRSIVKYDESSSVNNFTVGGVNVWLDKATRAGLLLRFESEKALGKEETTLWYGSMSFPLPVDTAIQMLYAIESYASACYDNTQMIMASVEGIESIEGLLEFDYKKGYPQQLAF